MTDDTNRLMFTAKEMAKRCAITPATWSRWVKKGIAPQPVKLDANTRKWAAVVVDHWMKRLIKES